MQTVLCFDLGNTRSKFAVFKEGKFEQECIMKDASLDSFQNAWNEYRPSKTVLSSVVKHDPNVESYLSKVSLFHKITSLSKMPCRMPIGKPETVGADRWTMLAAAQNAFPEKHCLIIGLGSCITYNFLNRFEQFLGGAISPGLHMRFKAMHDHTALLPHVDPKWNFPLVGYDTETNLLSGVILGMSKEIDGIIDEYKARYADLQVLMTGGDMSFFMPHLRNKVVADPILIYKGMYIIAMYNWEEENA